MPTTVEARILAQLAEKGWRLATAESLTGGLLADAFVSVPGASAVFSGGVIAYDTAVKHSILGVDADLLAERGAVDPDVAIQMAVGARRALAVNERSTEVAISTTGVAGPDPADGHPVGTVFIGVSTPAGDSARRLDLAGTRAEIRHETVRRAVLVLADVLSTSLLPGNP